MMDIARAIVKLTAPLQRRVRVMIARAVVNLVNDTTMLQSVQVATQLDELHDDVEHFQGYGFTAVPLPGSEAILLCVGADAEHVIALAVEDRTVRPTGLAPGEVALYTATHAKRVYLKADGTVNLGTAPTDFVALATNTEARLAALEAFALNHVHVCAAPSSPGSTATPPPVLNTPPAPVTATQVKAL